MDAFQIMQLMDPEKVRRARNSTIESVIGSLQALSSAAFDYRTFVTESTQAARPKVARPLESVTPTWVAERLGITTQAVTLAARGGHIPGAEQIDGRWKIPLAGYEHYRKTRSI
jgi:hypothetical protein